MNVKIRLLALTAVVGLLSTACLRLFLTVWGATMSLDTYPEQRYGSDRLVRYAESWRAGG
jgi:hypothetical protein